MLLIFEFQLIVLNSDFVLCTRKANFSSYEVFSLALKLPQFKVTFFVIYQPPSSSSFSKPFSCFLDEFTSFLSITATTPHEFIITGDFSLHLDNPSDHLTSQFPHLTSQFPSVLSLFNLTQNVDLSTHNKSHILDLVIISSDSSLAPSLSTTLCTPLDTSQYSPNCQLFPHHCLLRAIHSAIFIQ